MTESAPETASATVTQAERVRGPWADVWAQFRKHKGAMMALVMLGALTLFCLVGPLIWRIDPNFIESDTVKMFKMRNQGPSLAHPLGTDQLGRDMLARMMFGGAYPWPWGWSRCWSPFSSARRWG